MLFKIQKTPRGVPNEGEPLTPNPSSPKKFSIFSADELHNEISLCYFSNWKRFAFLLLSFC